MEFRALYTLQTDDNIPLNVELAGAANRVFAFAIDFLTMGLAMGAAFLVHLFILSKNQEAAKTFLPLAMFVIFFGFHLAQEWLWNGKTLGKALFNIRVVRLNGQAIGFWEAFGRNLLRVVDVYVSGIGLIVMMFSRQERRFGDYIAGTIVIDDQAIKRAAVKPTLENIEALEAKQAESLAATNLTAEEYELLRSFRARREELFPESRKELATALARYFRARLHYLREEDQSLSDEALLDVLWHQYRGNTVN